MAKTNARVKVIPQKNKIYADYNVSSRDTHDLVISCQAFKLSDEYSFITFKNEQVQ